MVGPWDANDKSKARSFFSYSLRQTRFYLQYSFPLFFRKGQQQYWLRKTKTVSLASTSTDLKIRDSVHLKNSKVGIDQKIKIVSYPPQYSVVWFYHQNREVLWCTAQFRQDERVESKGFKSAFPITFKCFQHHTGQGYVQRST